MLTATLLLLQAPTVYVSTLNGRDGASGDLGAPMASLTEAVRKVEKAGGGIVVVEAPVTNPIREVLDAKAAVNLTVKGSNGAEWFMTAAETMKGWEKRGDDWETTWPAKASTLRGVWMGSAPFGKPALLRPVKKGDLAPGTFSQNGSKMRVRLSNDQDPNAFGVQASVRRACVWVRNGGGKLTLMGAKMRGGYEGTVLIRNDKDGTKVSLAAQDCSAWYGESGWRVVGYESETVLTRCEGGYTENDGFNLHGRKNVKNVMRLLECRGIGNEDEGASPHDDTEMYIEGGLYADNKYSGFCSVGNAYAEITGATFRNNHSAKNDPTEGGISFKGNSRGKVVRVKLEGNVGTPVFSANPNTLTIVKD
ncbi:hypothetical protein EON79_15855 [bacterium]|nr:MAG: hypothetical protein EON79_15855 [bacterium]